MFAIVSEMLKKIKNRTLKIAVIGMGYVGMPLAIEFGKKFDTIGFDIDESLVAELQKGGHPRLDVSREEISEASRLRFSGTPADMADRDFFIVTVPTPVDRENQPDLTPLDRADEMIGKVMKRGAVVVYESTVYPGCTEEKCVPVLEKFSNLRYNQDFFCGYSPERINPGDKRHTLTNIVKITSGSTPEIADAVDALYNTILLNGTCRVSSIKVAEAAKVIENSQRDINIAFVNELAKIFHLIGVDTKEVLDAAATKWNFLRFTPGLVGGHCIGVDPYYLIHKAQSAGYRPEVITAGRRVNDSMALYVASETVKLLIKKDLPVKGAKILQLGITFKENCPDIRNSKAADVVRCLSEFGCAVTVCDPRALPSEVAREYGMELLNTLPDEKFDAVVLAVAHREFSGISDVRALLKDPAGGVVYDIKGFLPDGVSDGRL